MTVIAPDGVTPLKFGKHRLATYDPFSRDWSEPFGDFNSDAAAEAEADKLLKQYERIQPSHRSGGQGPGGLQTQVFVISPDGLKYRYLRL